MFKKIILLFVAVFVLLSAFTINILAADEIGTAIKCTYTYTSLVQGVTGGGYNINGYDAYPYVFQKGDKIEYEVYLENNTPGLGFLEVSGFKQSGVDADGLIVGTWKNLRDFTGMDTDGTIMHPDNDLSTFAYKKWYKRTMIIPVGFDGFTARHWFPYALHHEMPAGPEVCYIRNIKVIGADGAVKQVVNDKDNPFIVAQKVETFGGTVKMEQVGAVEPESSSSSKATSSTSSTASETTNSISSSSNAQDTTDTDSSNNLVIGIVIGFAGACVIIGGSGLVYHFYFKKKKNV